MIPIYTFVEHGRRSPTRREAPKDARGGGGEARAREAVVSLSRSGMWTGRALRVASASF